MKYRSLESILLLILFGFVSQNFAQVNTSLLPNQFEGLELDKMEAFMLCPFDPLFGINPENPFVEVTTKVSGQSQNLKYQYSVSGGRIIGAGAKVNWDLNKMPIGLYKIRVDVRGKKLRKTFVKEIRLKVPSHCSIPCACPSLSVISSSQTVKEGKNIILTAQVAGGTQTEATYKWLITEGEIFKGQGTPKIQIKTNGLKGKKITATVEIGGDLCAECYRMEQITVEIN